MAHLHKCPCGRTFRCDGKTVNWNDSWNGDVTYNGEGHKPAWYWCQFECPDAREHGMGLIPYLDAQFLQMIDEALKGTKFERDDE